MCPSPEGEKAMRMETAVYKAAIYGDVNFLNEALSGEKERSLLTQITIKHNNIIHLAVQHGRFQFLEMALPSFPLLVSQTNSAGDTPLHIAAKEGDMRIIKLLVDIGKSESPWKMKNLEGNTPLHMALIHGKVSAAKYLLEIDPDVASVLNNSMETPLHVAARYSIHGKKELAIGAIQIINTHKVGVAYKGCVLADDPLSVIELLLQKNKCAACLYDTDELTPLLRAALKSHVAAIRSIVSECPESVEMFDSKGKTILHLFKSRSYEEAMELLQITEIHALKNVQDRDGNTPIHMAVMNRDVHMVSVLLECSANLAIENKDGICAGALIHQQQKDFLATKIPLQVDLNDQDIVKTSGKMMAKELFEAAVAGDLFFLRQKLRNNETEYLLSRTKDRRNIIHVAFQTQLDIACAMHLDIFSFNSFIYEALESLPVLLCQIDSNGDTPLHLLVRKQCPPFHLRKLKDWFEKAKEEALDSCNQQLYLPPWKVKNVNGNTPIHEALLNDIIYNAIPLIQIDPDVVHDVNNDKQTVLHLLCSSVTDWDITADNLMDKIIEANQFSVDARDSEGLTPLLRAGRNKRGWSAAQKMLDRSPQIMKHCDHNGNTVLHLMAYTTEFDIDTAKKLVKTLEPLWYKENNEGNTPPQLALREGNFGLFKLFIEEDKDNKIFGERKQARKTKILLGSAKHIPPEIRKLVWEKWVVASQIFGYRTICGIPTTEIKDYINTMSVTAALLTTITFTAAFTVPGGFDSDIGTLKGTPILAKKAAFSVFMVSDIAAMCFSMMVLFCLLWIMSGDPQETVVLLDFSVLLLQTSFYATLVAFMAGVYVTVIPVVPWLAIFPLVACSVLILLMHNRIIMGAVPCFLNFYQFYLTIGYLISESVLYLKHKVSRLCCPPTQNDEGNNSPTLFEHGSWLDLFKTFGKLVWYRISRPLTKICIRGPTTQNVN